MTAASKVKYITFKPGRASVVKVGKNWVASGATGGGRPLFAGMFAGPRSEPEPLMVRISIEDTWQAAHAAARIIAKGRMPGE